MNTLHTCERCGTQFEGRNCPRCDAPAEKIAYKPERKLPPKPFIVLCGVLLMLFTAAAITMAAFFHREANRLPTAEPETTFSRPDTAEHRGTTPEDAPTPDNAAADIPADSPAPAADASLTDSEAAAKWRQNSGVYPAGEYAIGKDIPAGEYIILSDGIGYGDFFTGVYASPSMSDASEIWFEWQQGSAYIVLEEGQYLDFAHATLYDPALVDITLDPAAGSGMYKCGKDFDPGDYRIIPTNTQYGAEYTIYSALTSSGGIVRGSNYSDSKDAIEVTLAEGEYIALKFARLEKS